MYFLITSNKNYKLTILKKKTVKTTQKKIIFQSKNQLSANK